MELTFTVTKRSSEHWNMPAPEFHGEFEVLFPLSGSGHMFADQRVYPLQRGMLFVMDAAAPHRTLSRGETDYVRCALHFPQETLDGLGIYTLPDLLAEKGCGLPLTEEECAFCEALFNEMLLIGEGLPGELRRSAAFVRLMALILDKWAQSPHVPPAFAEDSVIAAVISYIRTHLEEEITLDALAERFFLSKSTLCHRFRAVTGFSVMEYVIQCRIQHSRTLLARGSSVREAGEASGFGDNANFIRSFRRLTGITPGQYAKSVRKKWTGGRNVE